MYISKEDRLCVLELFTTVTSKVTRLTKYNVLYPEQVDIIAGIEADIQATVIRASELLKV